MDKWYKGAFTWVGQPEDVEFAIYLSELVQAASERAYRDHRKGLIRKPTKHWRESFLGGFGLGIRNRLVAIERERRNQRGRQSMTGTTLAVVKDQIIASYMEENYPAIQSEKRRQSQDADPFAAIMGMRAAQHLDVSAPLTDRSEDHDALRGALKGGD